MVSRVLPALAFGAAVLTVAAFADQNTGRTPRRAAARPAAAVPADEAIALTNGWAMLAEGRGADAAARAEQVLAGNPRSGAALMLAVEARMFQGGAAAGMARYESWLGQRAIEEPAVLRRIAVAILREAAAQKQDATARLEAIRALVEDGDTDAANLLPAAERPKADARTRTRAALGDEQAVRALITELNTSPASPVRSIEALGTSGSRLAVAPLVDRLDDPRQEVRGAAVDALGKLGDADLVPRITPLLRDHSLHVRVRAAGALLQIGDYSGFSMLQGLMAHQSPEIRLLAAEAMASRPDGSWAAVVEELTREDDPQIRAAAARLLAPHEPEVARAVLEPLMSNENPAVRELASQALGEVTTSDLTTLRGMMKNSVRLTRVRASARVLALTR